MDVISFRSIKHSSQTHFDFKLAYDFERYFCFCPMCKKIMPWNEIKEQLVVSSAKSPFFHSQLYHASHEQCWIGFLVPERKEEYNHTAYSKYAIYTDEFDKLTLSEQADVMSKMTESEIAISEEASAYFRRLQNPRINDPKHPLCAKCGSYNSHKIRYFEKWLRVFQGKEDRDFRCNECGYEWNISNQVYKVRDDIFTIELHHE